VLKHAPQRGSLFAERAIRSQGTRENIGVEKDQWATKRMARPVLKFNLVWAAQQIPAGNEVMHLVKKRQPGTGAEHIANRASLHLVLMISL
jgi:hypothetical protein